MNTQKVVELILKIAEKIEENRDYLTELDMPIGDSDHGINMARGFAAVTEKLKAAEQKDIGTVLKMTGMTLVSQVGGSAGPLYGTAFMYAGKLLDGKQEVTCNDFPEILKTAIDGVQMRGKAVLGEATMLDAMIPSYEAAESAVSQGLGAHEILAKVCAAAKKGAESTILMVATKGRASYVGERGIGHQDPGATSFSLIMETILESEELK